MRSAGILPGVVSAQGFSKRKARHVIANLIRDKDKRTGRFAGATKKVMIFNWRGQKLNTHTG